MLAKAPLGNAPTVQSGTVSILPVLLLVLVMLTWEGVLPAILGVDVFLGKQIGALIIMFGWGFILLRPLTVRIVLGLDFLIAVSFISYCFIASIMYSTFLYSYPISEWLFASYMFLPLFIYPLLRGCGVSWRGVILAIVIAASICSLISIIDQFARFPIFDQFVRGSINDRAHRRMFFMRVETGASIVIVLFWLLGLQRRLKASVIALAVFSLVINVFVLFRVSESRQSIMAVLIATLLAILFGALPRERLVKLAPFGFIISVPVLYILVQPYLEKLAGANDYVRDGNLLIRFQSMSFYYSHFQETNGLGFGILSSGNNARNFFALAQRVGNGSWPFYLADTGIMSAFYQFGLVGLTFAVGMPLWLGSRLRKLSRFFRGEQRALLVGLGAFLIGSVLHPWPQNYFTLDWSIMFGSLAWFCCIDLDQRAPRTSNTNLH